jgi:hypothetical protein
MIHFPDLKAVWASDNRLPWNLAINTSLTVLLAGVQRGMLIRQQQFNSGSISGT